MSSENYIRASAKRAQTVLKEHALFGDIQLVIKDAFQENIDVEDVFRTIEKRIPQYLLRESVAFDTSRNTILISSASRFFPSGISRVGSGVSCATISIASIAATTSRQTNSPSTTSCRNRAAAAPAGATS